MWNELDGEKLGGVNFELLQIFVFAICGLATEKQVNINKQNTQESHQSQNISITQQKESKDPSQQKKYIFQDKNQQNSYIFKEQNLKKIQKDFLLFYQTRQQLISYKGKSIYEDQNSKFLNQEAKYFEQQIKNNKNESQNRSLSCSSTFSNCFSQTSHADLINKINQQKEKQKQKQKLQMLEEQQKTYTFNPQINQYKSNPSTPKAQRLENQYLSSCKSQENLQKANGKDRSTQLYEHSKLKKQLQEKLIKEHQEEREKEVSQYSFSPDLSATNSANLMKQKQKFKQADVKGSNKVIFRMKLAQTLKEELQKQLEKGTTYTGDSWTKNTINIDSYGKYDINHEFTSSQGFDPLMYVDITLKPGISDRIVVFPGDTAVQLAKNFAQDHNLDEKHKQKLQAMLQQCIDEEKQMLSQKVKEIVFQ